MSQNVESLFAALLGNVPIPPAVSGGLAPPATKPAPGGDTSTALQHYRQALESVRRGDWRQFGVEMDALRNALESGATVP